MEKIKTGIKLSNYSGYQKHRESAENAGRENTFYVRADLNQLKNKLKKGSQLKAKIVLVLKNNKYLLRFLGNNYVMASKLVFNRFDEVIVSVEQTVPVLELKILPVTATKSNNNNRMDITV